MNPSRAIGARALALFGLLALGMPAAAVPIDYQVEFNVTGPEASGNPHSGTFSYDDSTGSVGFGGETSYPLTDLSLSFAGIGFTELDDLLGQAIFGWDGNFLGIEYDASVAGTSISFSPGLLGLDPVVPSDPTTASFSYMLAAGDSGGSTGPLVYTQVPLPAPVLLAASLWPLVLVARRRAVTG